MYAKKLMLCGALSLFSMTALADVTVTMYLTKPVSADTQNTTTDVNTTDKKNNTTDLQTTDATKETKKPAEKKVSIGTITFKTSAYGLMMEPDLHGLTPGMHGIHLHEYASCDDHGKAAGGHLDPNHSDAHNGPYQTTGHLGDLPGLFVDPAGDANHPILAPRLQESDLYGHSIVIHAGSDNYMDSPAVLGGGGERIACGVIKKVENNE